MGLKQSSNYPIGGSGAIELHHSQRKLCSNKNINKYKIGKGGEIFHHLLDWRKSVEISGHKIKVRLLKGTPLFLVRLFCNDSSCQDPLLLPKQAHGFITASPPKPTTINQHNKEEIRNLLRVLQYNLHKLRTQFLLTCTTLTDYLLVSITKSSNMYYPNLRIGKTFLCDLKITIFGCSIISRYPYETVAVRNLKIVLEKSFKSKLTTMYVNFYAMLFFFSSSFGLVFHTDYWISSG